MPRLATVSTVEALQVALERRVLDGGFGAGEHLREIDLAREYAVGRNTLRAAFDGLVRRGILSKQPNRGVFVRTLTATDLVEVYELRAALEVQAVRMLAGRRQVPRGAREALARQRRLGPRSERRARVEADLAFHRAIVGGAGNARMARVLEDIEAEVLLCLAQVVQGYPGASSRLAVEHSELLEAIESGRPGAAETAVRHHLQAVSAWLVEQAEGRAGAEPPRGVGASPPRSPRGGEAVPRPRLALSGHDV